MTGSPPSSRRDIAIGALLMTTAMLSFVLLDSVLKHLVRTHDALLLTFFRNLAQAFILVMLVPVFGPAAMLRTGRPALHVARSVFLIGTTILMTLSLKYLGLVETYAITFTAPLIAVLVAAAVLRERVSRGQWICILVGFAGVLVILQPAGATASWALLYPLGMAAVNGCFHVLTRYTGRTEPPMAMLFHASMWATLLSALPLPFVWQTPSWQALGLLALGGAFGTAAHLCLIQAFRRAPTAVISPMLYSQIIWASLAGWVFFSEVPAMATLAGGVVIAASGIVLVRISARRAT